MTQSWVLASLVQFMVLSSLLTKLALMDIWLLVQRLEPIYPMDLVFIPMYLGCNQRCVMDHKQQNQNKGIMASKVNDQNEGIMDCRPK